MHFGGSDAGYSHSDFALAMAPVHHKAEANAERRADGDANSNIVKSDSHPGSNGDANRQAVAQGFFIAPPVQVYSRGARSQGCKIFTDAIPAAVAA